VTEDAYEAGMRVRREVLGDAHIEQATESATDLTRPFQEFITRYAWASIWTRDGLDRRSRSMITLAVLTALGREQELALHVRAARTNGLRRRGDRRGPAPHRDLRGRSRRQRRPRHCPARPARDGPAES
jgi:Carboxymuconolactone decarboxylase family